MHGRGLPHASDMVVLGQAHRGGCGNLFDLEVLTMDTVDKPVGYIVTRVINISLAPKDWKSNPDFAYIGRAGKGLVGYFGNPFRLKPGLAPGSTLAAYKEHFEKRLLSDPQFRARVEALRGKTLVCFCKPAPCHGDIISEYLNGKGGA